jgi:site-specific DNA recombinase
MASIGTDRKGARIQCSADRESGSCSNGRRVYLDEIESIVIKGLRHHLEHPEVITEYVTVYNAERQRLKRQAISERGQLERRHGGINSEINRLVDAIVKGATSESIAQRIMELEAERATLGAALEAAKEADNVIALHPQALTRYKRDVMELADELKRGDPDGNAGVFTRIRSLVTAIVVHAAPSAAGGDARKAAEQRRIRIDLKGRLAELCDNSAVFPNVSMSGGTLVARERYRQTPPGKTREFCIKMTG